MAWLAVLFVVERTGQPFDSVSFTGLWQLVPFENLRADPFGSVWNLHIQPPLWNLLLGVIGRWSPLSLDWSLRLLMAGFGFAATVLLCDTLRRAGVRTRWAVVLTLFVMCAPDVLSDALEPRYELAVAAGLIAMAWFVVRGAQASERGRWLVLLSLTATAIVMTRTLYHPLWLVLVVGFYAWRWRASITRRALAVSVLLPLVFVGGWMLKNQVLFGRFTLSTWSGMNLERSVIPLLHADDKEKMLADGELSEVSAAGAFAPYEDYVPAVGPCTSTASSPVLSRLTRDGPFAGPNFNAECFLRVYDIAGEDARTAIRAHPDAYIEGRLWSGRRWFALEDSITQSKSGVFRALHLTYRFAELGVPGTTMVSNWGTPILGTTDVIQHFSLLAVACSIAVLLAPFGRRRRRRGRDLLDLEVFVAFVTAWTFASGVLFELGEQPRFRSMIDPLVFSFGLVALVRAGRVLVKSDGPSETVESP